jgi:UDP-N-acetylglucosamine acyltransferase
MIHPTAIIDSSAELSRDVDVGPYCVIQGKVTIGEGTKVGSHVVIQGSTTIGRGCTIAPFASIGGPPQDISYKGEDTELVIGDRNDIKEYVTINRGSVKGGGITTVGNANFIMAYAHIAHDCRVGNNVIMANCATLAGHVEIDDFVSFSGLCAIHQFCRVGKYAFISGLTGAPMDIPPYIIAAGDRAKPYGINVVGLERHGFSKEEISTLKKAYRLLFRSSLPLKTSLKIIQEELEGPQIDELINFIQSSKRGICR